MIDVPIHQAVSVSTEVDVPIWIYGKKPCCGKPVAMRYKGLPRKPSFQPLKRTATRCCCWASPPRRARH